MRALVISGEGSKGAFAGGMAQYLLEEEKHCTYIIKTYFNAIRSFNFSLKKTKNPFFRGMDFDKKLNYFILTLKNLQLDWTRLLLRVSYWHRPR